MEPTLAGNIVDLILSIEPGTRLGIEVEGYRFGTNKPRDPEDLWRINSATPDMQLTLEKAMASSPTKIFFRYLDRDLSYIVEAISARFRNEISIIPREHNTLVSVTASRATKPNTMKHLLDSRGITLDEVLAFGDDTPDLEMLEACGISVAMANAIPEVKAVCRYHTAGNDDDGVALVLEKLITTLECRNAGEQI